MISPVQAEKLIEKGYEAYLAIIAIPYSGAVGFVNIWVVQEFEDVFQLLQGLTVLRSDSFTIELKPGTMSISKAPYRRALAEMAELKKQVGGVAW